MRKNKISVIGAGAWGTALAQVLGSAGHDITIYARSTMQVADINNLKENTKYLKNIKLNSNIKATNKIEIAVENADIILMVVPTQFTRNALTKIKPHIKQDTFIINCSKGIEISSGEILSQVTKEIIPNNPYAVLSGPTFALEVASGLPTAVTLATLEKKESAENIANILSSNSFRPYLSDDVIGTEIVGAVKNVIAIACGIIAGKQLGENAKASVITRGMAEIKRLGLKLEAKTETFLGLSGIGDLSLTCNSALSRNYSLGFKLGQGYSLENIIKNKHTVSEGVSTAKAVIKLIEGLNIEMPICTAIYNVLYNNGDIDSIIKELMKRRLKSENL